MRNRDTGRLLGHFARNSIAIGLTVTIAWCFGDRQGHRGEEGSESEAEASHLDVRCMYVVAFGKYFMDQSVEDELDLQLQAYQGFGKRVNGFCKDEGFRLLKESNERLLCQ